MGLRSWCQSWWYAFVSLTFLFRLAFGMLKVQLQQLWHRRKASRVSLGADTSMSTSLNESLHCVHEGRYNAIDSFFLRACDSSGSLPSWSVIIEASTQQSLQYSQLETLIVELGQMFALYFAKIFSAEPTALVGNEQKEGKDASPDTLNAVAALMMSNAPEYYAMWLAVSQASNYLNVVHYDGNPNCSSSTSRSAQSSTGNITSFINCSTALLNTNITSNAMFCGAITTSHASILIIEPSYLSLLIDDDADGQGSSSSSPMKISLPSCVNMVCLWDQYEVVKSYDDIVKLFQAENCSVLFVNLSKELTLVRQSTMQMKRYRRVHAPIFYDALQKEQLHLCSMGLIKARVAKFSLTAPILMIYTSGTTGLPKAAKFSHLRFRGAILLTQLLPIKRSHLANDGNNQLVFTMYNPLPMYHSAGGVFCLAHLLSALTRKEFHGVHVRMVIRRKFSASNFKTDLVNFHVTIVQYIGELFRYALSAEEKKLAEDKKIARNVAFSSLGKSNHQLPFAFGNGLRPDLWLNAKTTFDIQHIVEFYASTEGNVGLINLFNEPFAIGHLPVFPFPLTWLSPIFFRMFPMKFVRFDAQTEEPLRNPATGRCFQSDFDEPAELMGAVATGFDPMGLRRFEGYLNNEGATSKKLVRNVFKKNDLYFRSGDLARFDRRGFVYFVDRVGDTFRWKGENVSTLEVANALNTVSWKKNEQHHVVIEDAVVYGVQIPKHEGRAGMARIRLISMPEAERLPEEMEKEFFTQNLFALLYSKGQPYSLPSYAIPVFLRIELNDPLVDDAVAEQTSNAYVSPIQASSPDRNRHRLQNDHQARKPNFDDSTMTGTFKYRKVALQKDGFSLLEGERRIFVLRKSEKCYIPLTAALCEKLNQGMDIDSI